MNDADLEMIELAEAANEIAHAIKRGYCLDCDHNSGPHTYRIWTPGAATAPNNTTVSDRSASTGAALVANLIT